MPVQEPRFVLHIGAVPTASWVVHQCLEQNRAAWRERGLYCLPNKVLTDDIGSGDKLIDDPAPFADALRLACAEPDTGVVAGSREILGPPFLGAAGDGLHAQAQPAAHALAGVTEPYRRSVVLSVCSPEQLLELHYNRAIAAGESAQPDEWLSRVDLDNLSWLPLHRMLCAEFGAEAVSTVEFRSSADGHGAWLQRFFSIVGVDLPAAVLKRTPPPAVRLSDKGQRLAVAANPHLASARERSDLRDFLQRRFSEVDGPPRELLTPAQVASVRQRYDAERAELLSTSSPTASDGARG